MRGVSEYPDRHAVEAVEGAEAVFGSAYEAVGTVVERGLTVKVAVDYVRGAD